ncbi:pickpocket protein 28-like [Melanaphis sacchari]|uniref:pickpocket protein 28-like n=1 Tax=Melanaphis sacchari TaxID=742174 RepID=UPI000DC15AA6|nr:pickpocket protein 28-like [Melanaphis sacchari]
MDTRKNENEQLENLLTRYFKTRSFFPYGAVKDDKLSTYRKNSLVHQKYNKPESPIFEFKTFCSMTSLHGFFHFVENNFSKIGKFCWAILLMAIYILCGVSIYFLIRMFLEMPAIISLDNSVSSIWTIPFPAITICSANQVRPSVYNYSDINITNYEDQLIQNIIYGVCKNNRTEKKWISEDYLVGSSVSQALKNLSFPCKEVVKSFFWLWKIEIDPCNVLFQETFTPYGLCYSFNMMPMIDLLNGVDEWSQDFNNYSWKKYHSSWKPDTGYRSDALTSHLPLRTFGDGDYHSATMKLELHSDDMNKECAHGLDVFYILVHSPAEWPARSHPTLLVTTNTISTISIKPVVLTTNKELIPWDSKIRHCYFQNESKLKFFKVYTKNNCILECRSSSVLSQCGCVPFYYLRMKNTPVCGPAKMSCWLNASYASSESCDCLPGCTEFFFKTSSMNAHLTKPARKDDKNNLTSSSLILSVYYQSINFIGFNRIMISTFGQFMGKLGGIMGLCLGFSFLSLVEIFYFLTLRPLVNFCNSKKKLKKVAPTLILGKE